MEQFKEKWGEWLVLSNEIKEEKIPGKLKEEFQTCSGQMIGLCAKSYIAECLKEDKVKDGRKGISNHVQLRVEEFKDVLYNGAQHKTTITSLRLNKDHQMARTSTRKRGLSSIHVKLGVQDDKITCHPLKDRNGEEL